MGERPSTGWSMQRWRGEFTIKVVLTMSREREREREREEEKSVKITCRLHRLPRLYKNQQYFLHGVHYCIIDFIVATKCCNLIGHI